MEQTNVPMHSLERTWLLFCNLDTMPTYSTRTGTQQLLAIVAVYIPAPPSFPIHHTQATLILNGAQEIQLPRYLGIQYHGPAKLFQPPQSYPGPQIFNAKLWVKFFSTAPPRTSPSTTLFFLITISTPYLDALFVVPSSGIPSLWRQDGRLCPAAHRHGRAQLA